MGLQNTKSQKYEHIVHPFPPLYDDDSEILILGSLPSVKSREQMFFYGHPQNRFWKVMSMVLGEELPTTIDEKKIMLHAHHIALWDAIYSCDIIGSSDSSIKNVIPTDLGEIISSSKVTKVICNGKTSGKYFSKYQQKELDIEPVILPSTSPANAAFSVDKLFHTKIGVKLCSMAGGGVSRNLWNFFRTAPAGTGQAVTCSTSGMGLRLK